MLAHSAFNRAVDARADEMEAAAAAEERTPHGPTSKLGMADALHAFILKHNRCETMRTAG